MKPAASGSARPAARQVSEVDESPLVIDLDGTLIRTDLLHEALIKVIVLHPRALLSMPGWLLKGKAVFKREVAALALPEASSLPFEFALIEWIRDERAKGRKIVLCTASDARLAHSVASETGLFDDVMASDGIINLSAEAKAHALIERFGPTGFDYAGNSRADLAVWAVCRRAIVVGPNRGLRAKAARVASVERDFKRPAAGLGAWCKALRLHHWPKNLLVFLPLLGAHDFTNLAALWATALAFLAFGLCASSVYIVNDLIDLESDRHHARKRYRPFADGRISISQGLIAAGALVISAFVIALLAVNTAFAIWLGIYLVSTAAYSLWLKQKMLVDSLVLAALYTLRLLAGAAAAAIPSGFWLLAFSMFLFLSLALVKRYSELVETFRQGRARAPGRDYNVDDLPLVEMLGIASGFSAVMVLALYINGDTVERLYPNREVVWLTVPVVLYWVSRIWLKAHRGELEDDPVVFALSDNLSRFTIFLFFVILLVAGWG